MQATIGRCFLCGRSLPQEGMADHLLACCPQKGGEEPLFLFHIRDADFPETFWLFLEMPQEAALAALDDVLRRVWVDCCGHASTFVIDGVTYGRRPRASIVDLVLDEQTHVAPMNPSLAELLTVGQEIDYAYDEVWPTELKVRLLAAYPGETPEEGFRIVARNYKPPRTCRLCDRQAEWLLTNAWPLEPYCDAHARAHPAWTTPDAFLPYVNSPRVGLCVYRGPQEAALRFEMLAPEHPADGEE